MSIPLQDCPFLKDMTCGSSKISPLRSCWVCIMCNLSIKTSGDWNWWFILCNKGQNFFVTLFSCLSTRTYSSCADNCEQSEKNAQLSWINPKNTFVELQRFPNKVLCGCNRLQSAKCRNFTVYQEHVLVLASFTSTMATKWMPKKNQSSSHWKDYL